MKSILDAVMEKPSAKVADELLFAIGESPIIRSRELIDYFITRESSIIPTFLENISRVCTYSGLAKVAQCLQPTLRLRDDFCANDIARIIEVIANKQQQSSNLKIPFTQLDKDAGEVTLSILMENYKNKKSIDLLYHTGNIRTLIDNALSPFDGMLSEHLDKIHGQAKFSDLNYHFYCDIFLDHNLPKTLKVFLENISENYEKIEILFNTLSHAGKLSKDYAESFRSYFGNGFLLDISHEEIHFNGNVDTYKSICELLDEAKVLKPKSLEGIIKSGKIPPLVTNVATSSYANKYIPPVLSELILNNLPTIIKSVKGINPGTILSLAEQSDKVKLLWDSVIQIERDVLAKTFLHPVPEEYVVRRILQGSQVTDPKEPSVSILCKVLVELILMRLPPQEYPESVFKINDDEYYKLKCLVGPALERDHSTKLRFVNAKRTILSDDFGL